MLAFLRLIPLGLLTAFAITLPNFAQADSRTGATSGCYGEDIFYAEYCPNDGLDAEEERLLSLINSYRSQYGLSPISPSPSLSLVANRHVLDLQNNIGTLTHGWSNCPYEASDPNTYACMWQAPQRLRTAYPGNGYENAYMSSGVVRAEDVLATWQNSPGHNAVLLNSGIWQNRSWQAIGIGIYGNYAVLWVGEEPDPAN